MGSDGHLFVFLRIYLFNYFSDLSSVGIRYPYKEWWSFKPVGYFKKVFRIFSNLPGFSPLILGLRNGIKVDPKFLCEVSRIFNMNMGPNFLSILRVCLPHIHRFSAYIFKLFLIKCNDNQIFTIKIGSAQFHSQHTVWGWKAH